MKSKVSWLFGLNAAPPKPLSVFLGLAPFILILAFYFRVSHLRHVENKYDVIVPTATQMVKAVHRLATEEDIRTGRIILVQDTTSSLYRLGLGILAAAIVGLFLGINMGLFPGLASICVPVLTFISNIPPLALLPMIFISFGVDEFAKIMLIFIGTFPLIARTVYHDTLKIPVEQKTKLLTLGASQLQVVYSGVLPQVFPRLVDTVRLSFGAGWLFLIAAEAIASMDGLGYRIFLVRRQLAMDVIIPYAMWITFLGFTIDQLLKRFVAWKYPWYTATK